MDLVQTLINSEKKRQQNTLDLIASENFTSPSVREAVGSVFMHKYSEGYPHARYYEGNEFVDKLETECRNQLLKLFDLKDKDWHVNVQTLSGSIANLAIYNAVLTPGDTILSMFLPDGGHLSHGWSYGESSQDIKGLGDNVYTGGDKKVSFVSKIYNIIQYKTDKQTFLFDYDEIEKLAKKVKPKLIITGGTAYPRNIDHKRFAEIAKEVGAFYHADCAHEAGLIAGKALPSPFEYADFVTFTTHKTFRGPRGAIAMCRKQFANKLDRSVFPGIQGGPFNHNIAGILQATIEAQTKEFREYAKQVVVNAKYLSNELKRRGFNVVTGGTDKHLILLDLRHASIKGAEFASRLAQVNIITNKNSVPWDDATPKNPSGLRIGTSSITTRGMKEKEMEEIAEMFELVYKNLSDVKSKVKHLCSKYPLEF
jgi:glycine hydroxymethyltransferase